MKKIITMLLVISCILLSNILLASDVESGTSQVDIESEVESEITGAVTLGNQVVESTNQSGEITKKFNYVGGQLVSAEIYKNQVLKQITTYNQNQVMSIEVFTANRTTVDYFENRQIIQTEHYIDQELTQISYFEAGVIKKTEYYLEGAIYQIDYFRDGQLLTREIVEGNHTSIEIYQDDLIMSKIVYVDGIRNQIYKYKDGEISYFAQLDGYDLQTETTFVEGEVSTVKAYQDDRLSSQLVYQNQVLVSKKDYGGNQNEVS